MKAPLLVTTVALSVLLGGCGAPAASTPQPPSIDTPSAAPETSPSATIPVANPSKQVPKEKQVFYDGGQKLSYEEKVQANALPVTEYKNGVKASDGFFDNLEEIVNHYPTDEEVRNNLGYPAGQKLTRDDYMLAVGLYVDTYNVNYDGVPSTTGNTLAAVIRRIATKNVEQRYNVQNDNDASNDGPFSATITLSEAQTSFTYVDNKFNTTEDKYGISVTRGMSLSYGEIANYQYPSNAQLTAK
jgi:hypothetical protein